MFYCDSPGLFCILWNLLSIPIRLSLTVIILVVMAALLFPLSILFIIWIIIGLVGGFTLIACEFISNAGCPLVFFMILFYPITGLIGTVYALYEMR